MKIKRMGRLLIILAVVTALIVCFPKIFWGIHNHNTSRLQGKYLQGVNEIEWTYGQDEVSEVTSVDYVISDTLTYTMLYPKAMETDTKVYPVVVWGNGTGNTYVNYLASLKSLASYGFIVIGCNSSRMGDGQLQYEMGLYLKQLNHDESSLFYGRINESRIGVAGHSQGACGAVNAATKYPESTTLFQSLYTTSMPKLEMCKDDDRYQFAYWAYDVSKIAVPYFATSGTYFLDSMWISPLSSMQENFSRLGDIRAWMAREIGANHNIVNEYHGAGYFNAWFCYMLKDDMKAAEAFTPDGEIAHNTTRWKDWQYK